MILITGANGYFGSATVNFLLEKGVSSSQISVLVRNQKSAEEFKKQNVNVLIGDYDDYDSLIKAFKGIEKLLLVSGSDISKRLPQHQNVIKAAKETRVKHIVYTSFQRKDESAESPLWKVASSHLETEKSLKASGIPYTILKNNLYMDFLPGFIGENVLETGVIYVPAGDGKISALLRSEMAEAAANILITSSHEGKSYEFTNQEAVSYHEIAQIISEISGKTINYISPSVEDYKNTLSGFGLPTEAIEIFSSFAVAQAKGELDTVSSDIENLIGRKPVSIKSFLTNIYISNR